MDKQYLDSLTKPSIDNYYDFTDFASLMAFVDRAYKIFIIYPLIKQTGMCDCDICFHEPFITEWTNYSNINAIPDEVLHRYFSSELTDKSIVQQQVRALLPRLISSFIQGKEFGILGRYGAFNHCQFANNQFWLKSERQLMQDFALSYFDLYVNHPDGWKRFIEFEGEMILSRCFIWQD